MKRIEISGRAFPAVLLSTAVACLLVPLAVQAVILLHNRSDLARMGGARIAAAQQR